MPEKILHLISSNGFYGAENVLLEICLGLKASSQFKPVIGLLNTGNRGHLPLLRECRRHNLTCVEFPCRGRYDKALIRELRRFVQSSGITVVHSHGYKSNFYAFFVRSSGAALVTTCHNWIISDLKMRCFIWLDKILLRFFNSVVCVSRPIQMELERWRVGKLSLIYNGVNISTFEKDNARRHEIRHRLGLTDREQVIGFVGRVSNEKGINILLECGADIHSSFPDLHIVLVGDIVGNDQLKERLKNEKNGYLHVVGVQSDVVSFYSAFDIFVLPSLTEGLPMVILEAMAARLPVIASSVGSIPEVVENGKTGYLIKPNSTSSLYQAMEHLLRCPDQMRGMGERGFEKVCREFTSKKMIQEYVTIYNSLLR
ncbi:MAG TPA: glycosyltransferase family 1 protein [Gammaproteobacteria bacterium]|nr:glycosyltransferase family 1 protein [Gammaproteobacteria bacterium]